MFGTRPSLKKGKTKKEIEFGYVYLCVEEPFSNKVKIGFTSGNEAKRLSGIQSGNPKKLKFHFITNPMPYYKTYERNLHLAFKHKHIRGEWFELCECDLFGLVEDMMEDEEILYDHEYHGEKIIKNVLEGVKYYALDIPDRPKPV